MFIDPKDLNIFAVIPIRGYSKIINDKPLIINTIESAKKSKFSENLLFPCCVHCG